MKHQVDPIATKIVSAINDGYASTDRGRARCYIGASMAGTDCIAQFALSLRGFPDVKIEPALQRIFSIGHTIEDVVVRDLKNKAGLRVWEKDDMTGRQHSAEWLNGHVVCHSDGIVDFEDGSPPAILEIKSMNDANWKKFKGYGVYVSHKKYYRQMQMMMAMFKIERSFFIAYNKNNSDYHAELVHFDQEEWDGMYVKIQQALDGQAERIGKEPEDWRCKSCFKREACWSQPDLAPACQYCKHSFADKHGTFSCKFSNKPELMACEKYEQFRPTPRV